MHFHVHRVFNIAACCHLCTAEEELERVNDVCRVDTGDYTGEVQYTLYQISISSFETSFCTGDMHKGPRRSQAHCQAQGGCLISSFRGSELLGRQASLIATVH
jgi:hypothetical protein